MNQRQRGFTLLEGIIAFVVLAIGLTAMGVSFGLAARTDMQLQSHRTALAIARSRLESAGITEQLAAGRRAGRDGELRWTETVTSVRVAGELSATHNPRPPTAPPAVQGFWVEVAVEANGGYVARLAVLKMQARAQP
jgi:general secretion pathway protein I